MGFLLADLHGHPRHVPDRLCRYRWDSETPADSGGHLQPDADIFPHYIHWYWLYISVQLLCFCPAGRGEFRPATDISGHIQHLKHCAGSLVCPGASPWRGRCRRCNGHRTGCGRYRDQYCRPSEKSAAVSVKGTAHLRRETFAQVGSYAFFTCLQQSVMNFGILMIQGLVNSFSTAIMAAFAAAVKIDTLAYMPVQEFGNAFSLFISQNYGAKRPKRVKAGIRTSVRVSVLFCIIISAAIWVFARPLMQIFVDAGETAIIAEGVRYLHIEGAFYWGIGCLFLLYGLYRAIERPAMSLVLTIVSLGTRVALAYALAPTTPLGVTAIWWAIPIGWILADLTGFIYYRKIHLSD